MTADRRLSWLDGGERQLWVLAIVLYGVGDTITTGTGLGTAEAAEIGPVVAPLVDRYGAIGLLGVKVATFALAAGVWNGLEPPTRVAIPFALAVVGAAVTGWNAAMVLAG